VGILGGVFNPPHVGHLICAQEAIIALELDRILLVPVGEASHREVEQDPGPAARVEMCELAVGGDERFEVSRLEVDRPGPSYTVDTLRELAAGGLGEEMFLLLGGDQAAALGTWHQPEEVLALATVAVLERAGAGRDEVARGLSGLRGAERVIFLDTPRIDVSSSFVRERAGAGLPIRYLVPDAVAGFIRDRGPYGARRTVAAR